MKVEYVTLSYYPQTFNVEHINVGFVLHDIESGKLYQRYVKKYNRWLEFDDRLNEEIIKDLLGFSSRIFDQTFGEDSEQSLFGINPMSKWKREQGYFDYISRNFQNQLRLSPTLVADVDNPESFFKEMCQLSLFFDYDKHERPKDTQIHSILLKQVKGILSSSSLKVSPRVSYQDNSEDEAILFDYMIGDSYLKIINPNGSNPTACIDRVKVWAYNSNYFQDASKMIVFIPLEGTDKDYYRYLKKILEKTNAKVFYSAYSLDNYIKAGVAA